MSRLPPFDALVAFEVAARLGGMTRAATELGLSQSAVSHRLRRLESFMGTQLLFRRNSGLVPTPAGRAVLDGLSDTLERMEDLRARCLTAASGDQLRVGVGAALADNWLVRRLPDFITHHPGSGIELVVLENEAPDRTADLDVRILWVAASESRASSTQRPLFQEHVFPVCHPALLPNHFVAGDALALTRLPLLHKGTVSYHSSEGWSWSAWFKRLGLPGEPREALRFSAIGPAIAAAVGGAGVVLARSILVR